MKYLINTFKLLITLALEPVAMLVVVNGIIFCMNAKWELFILYTAIPLPIYFSLPAWAFFLIGVVVIILGIYAVIRLTEALIDQIYFFKGETKIIELGPSVHRGKKRAAETGPPPAALAKPPVPFPLAEIEKPAERPPEKPPAPSAPEPEISPPARPPQMSRRIEEIYRPAEITIETPAEEMAVTPTEPKVPKKAKRIRERLRLKPLKKEEIPKESKEELEKAKKEIEENLTKEYKDRIKILKVE